MDQRILRFREDFAVMKAGGVTRPVMATVYPSYGCNFSCPGCHYNVWNEQGWQFVPVEPLLRRLEEAQSEGLRAVVLSGGGEPLFHKQIEAIVDGVLGLGLKLGVITNGTALLRPAGARLRDRLLAEADFVRVSIYPETDLEATLTLAAHPRNATLGLKFLVGASTVPFYLGAMDVLRDARWDYIEVKAERGSADDLSQSAEGKWAANIERHFHTLSPLVKGSLAKLEAPAVRCYLTPVHFVIDAVGAFLLCCFFQDRKQEHTFGQLSDPESFHDMWHGARHRAAREAIDMHLCSKWDCRFFGYLEISEAALADRAPAAEKLLRPEFDNDQVFI